MPVLAPSLFHCAAWSRVTAFQVGAQLDRQRTVTGWPVIKAVSQMHVVDHHSYGSLRSVGKDASVRMKAITVLIYHRRPQWHRC